MLFLIKLLSETRTYIRTRELTWHFTGVDDHSDVSSATGRYRHQSNLVGDDSRSQLIDDIGVLVSVAREHPICAVSIEDSSPARFVVADVLYLVAGHPVGVACAALCRHRMDHALSAQAELQMAADVISRHTAALCLHIKVTCHNAFNFVF